MSAPAGDMSSNRHSRVLVAEGDPVSLTHIEQLVTKIGYQVVMAQDGLHAAQILEAADAPNMAVLEWTLPGLSGVEVCRRLRRTESGQKPYLILTSPAQDDPIAGLEAGADAYLHKPLDIRELRIRLEVGVQTVAQRARRRGEERFRSAFDHAAIGTALLGPSAEFLESNPAFCSLLGYAEEELMMVNFQELCDPEHRKGCRTILDEFLASGQAAGEFERKVVTRKGSTILAAITVSRILSASGHTTGFVLQLQDIAERKETEEALRRSEVLLHAITDNAVDLIFVCDIQFKCLFSSSSFLPNLGYTPSEMLELDFEEIIHPDDLLLVKDAASAVAQDGKARTVTLRYRHKTGIWRHVEANGSALRNSTGTPEGFVVVARVVDERIRSEEQLQAAYAETEAFLQSIPSILIGLDSEGRVNRWNPVAAETFGLEGEAVYGRHLADCGIRWLHHGMESEIATWLQAKAFSRTDLTFDQNGRPRFLSLKTREIPGRRGDKNSFIVSAADITERRVLEEDLRQAQKLEAIGQLAAGIAHEINTPTQFVGDNVRFLKDSWEAMADLLRLCVTLREHTQTGAIPAPVLAEFAAACERSDLDYQLSEIPRAIDQSLDGVQRVAKIVRAIKEFSHPGSEEKKGVDLNRAIETTATVAKNEWKYIADLELHLDENLPLVPCLAGEMNQVFLNLIINAAHAIAGVVKKTQNRGKITITTRRDDCWAEIVIQDSGGGIPVEIRSRVFEPFFTTKAVGQGTGQGLALARTVVVNRHQGQIWFDSVAGEGTTFFIRLPLEVSKAPCPTESSS